MKVTACIENQDVTERILDHLGRKVHDTPARPILAPPARASPAVPFCEKGPEQNTRHHNSISRDTADHWVGMTSCELPAAVDPKRLARGPVQARFQQTERPSLGFIQVKHRDAGRAFPYIVLSFVLYFATVILQVVILGRRLW